MPKTKFVCQQCGKEFERWASSYPDGIAKYCSLKCNGLAQKDKETKSRELIKCDNCGKEYLIYKWHKERDKYHFCCSKCKGEYQSNQVELRCLCCGKSFKVKKSKEQQKYCSWSCRSKHLNGIYWKGFTSEKKQCPVCGKEFYARKSEVLKGKGIYCGKTCWAESMKDENPAESKHFYGTAFWRSLREECYKRDEYACQICGKQKGSNKLHAHHIKPRKAGGEDTLDNLITLCDSCHGHIEYRFKKARRAKLKTE